MVSGHFRTGAPRQSRTQKVRPLDDKKADFAGVFRDYEVVLNSLDKVTLEKSLRVLKAGGQLISISGRPTRRLREASARRGSSATGFGRKQSAPGHHWGYRERRAK
jgi:hypothetical protein